MLRIQWRHRHSVLYDMLWYDMNVVWSPTSWDGVLRRTRNLLVGVKMHLGVAKFLLHLLIDNLHVCCLPDDVLSLWSSCMLMTTAWPNYSSQVGMHYIWRRNFAVFDHIMSGLVSVLIPVILVIRRPLFGLGCGGWSWDSFANLKFLFVPGNICY